MVLAEALEDPGSNPGASINSALFRAELMEQEESRQEDQGGNPNPDLFLRFTFSYLLSRSFLFFWG